MGGLAELKRRKQEKELAERGGAEVVAEEEKPSEMGEEQQPGQLKHVSEVVSITSKYVLWRSCVSSPRSMSLPANVLAVVMVVSRERHTTQLGKLFVSQSG